MTDALREKIIHAGRVLVDEGQGDYVWGHISARLPDNPNRFLMKPGTLGLEEMTADNIITVDIEGDKVSGDWPRHNEVYIHSEVLRAHLAAPDEASALDAARCSAQDTPPGGEG